MFFNYHTFKKFQLKTSFKKIVNNETYNFFPLRHKNQPIYIKTPKIAVPFGLNTYADNESFVLSFNDSDIDPNIESFLDFLKKMETSCQQIVTQKANVDSLTFKSSLKEYDGTPLFRLKTSPLITELYDECDVLHSYDQIARLIVKQAQVICLLELSHIWMSPRDYGITWKVIQIKVYPPNKPIGGVSLLDEDINIIGSNHHMIQDPSMSISLPHLLLPPPPPPPPPSETDLQPVPRKFNPAALSGCFSLINTGHFSLKKVTINSPTHGNQAQVSLEEILKIRNNLRKKNDL
jgi:hypothetical protein